MNHCIHRDRMDNRRIMMQILMHLY